MENELRYGTVARLQLKHASMFNLGNNIVNVDRSYVLLPELFQYQHQNKNKQEQTKIEEIQSQEEAELDLLREIYPDDDLLKVTAEKLLRQGLVEPVTPTKECKNFAPKKQIMIGRIATKQESLEEQLNSSIPNQSEKIKRQLISQIDSFFHCSNSNTKFIDVKNKSISRRHVIIRFPFFKHNSHQNFQIIPSYFFKIFPSNISEQIILKIREFLIPEQKVIIKDLSSKFGLFRKMSEIHLQEIKYDYPYVLGLDEKHWMISSQNRDIANQLFSSDRLFQVQNAMRKSSMRKIGYNVLNQNTSFIKAFSETNALIQEDIKILITLGIQTNIMLSDMSHHENETALQKYSKQIQKQIKRENAYNIQRNKKQGTYFSQIRGQNQEERGQGNNIQGITTFRLQIISKSSEVLGELNVKQSYLLVASKKFKRTTFSIGRQSFNCIQIKKPDISQRHCDIICEIRQGHAKWIIRDKNSTNGVWLKVNEIKEPLSKMLPGSIKKKKGINKERGRVVFKIGDIQASIELIKQKFRVNQIEKQKQIKIEENKEKDGEESKVEASAQNVNNLRVNGEEQESNSSDSIVETTNILSDL